MATKVVLLVALSILITINSAVSASSFSPLRPPAIPLAVRSPYLNTWLNGDSGGILPGSWPRFWAYVPQKPTLSCVSFIDPVTTANDIQRTDHWMAGFCPS